MNNLPKDIELEILSYLKFCSKNEYHLVKKNWYIMKKKEFSNCDIQKIFNKNICITHNPEINKFFSITARYLY